jgi:hypothetical protein
MSKSKTVFVVTRDSRRIEEENYNTREAAKDRVDALAYMLKRWRDPDLRKIEIVKTTEPRKIR